VERAGPVESPVGFRLITGHLEFLTRKKFSGYWQNFFPCRHRKNGCWLCVGISSL